MNLGPYREQLPSGVYTLSRFGYPWYVQLRQRLACWLMGHAWRRGHRDWPTASPGPCGADCSWDMDACCSMQCFRVVCLRCGAVACIWKPAWEHAGTWVLLEEASRWRKKKSPRRRASQGARC